MSERMSCMISLRPISWPDDRARLLVLDTSFTTDRIFHLERSESCFELKEASVHPAFVKSYSLEADIDAMPGYDWVQVADADGAVVGVAAMTIQAWNRRAILQHLYVAKDARRMGVGRALVTAAVAAAAAGKARCLWVETQTVNHGAVQFYLSTGFRWCGLDTSLYDPSTVCVDEVALYFSREVG